jgi:hypothetical protein
VGRKKTRIDRRGTAVEALDSGSAHELQQITAFPSVSARVAAAIAQTPLPTLQRR